MGCISLYSNKDFSSLKNDLFVFQQAGIIQQQVLFYNFFFFFFFFFFFAVFGKMVLFGNTISILQLH